MAKPVELEWTTTLTFALRWRTTVRRKQFYMEGLLFSLIVAMLSWLIYAYSGNVMEVADFMLLLALGAGIYILAMAFRIVMLQWYIRRYDSDGKVTYKVKEGLLIVIVGREEVRMPIDMLRIQTILERAVSMSRKRLPMFNEMGIYFENNQQRDTFIEAVKTIQEMRAPSS